MDTFGIIKQAVINVRPHINAESITPEADLRKELALDSLAMVELTIALEDALGIELAEEDISEINTISDAINYVENRQKQV